MKQNCRRPPDSPSCKSFFYNLGTRVPLEAHNTWSHVLALPSLSLRVTLSPPSWRWQLEPLTCCGVATEARKNYSQLSKHLEKDHHSKVRQGKSRKIRPLALNGLCTIKTIKTLKSKHCYSPVSSHSRLVTQPTSKPNREVRRKIQ